MDVDFADVTDLFDAVTTTMFSEAEAGDRAATYGIIIRATAKRYWSLHLD